MAGLPPRRFRSSLTALLPAAVVLSVVAAGAAIIPVIRCPACGPLYLAILGPEGSGDCSSIDCPAATSAVE